MDYSLQLFSENGSIKKWHEFKREHNYIKVFNGYMKVFNGYN